MFNVAILTISDKGWRGERQDKSGEAIRESLAPLGVCVVKYDVVPDEKDIIAAKLVKWANGFQIDIVFTTGGTGLSPRDVTPEATLSIVERLAPGFVEAMRTQSLKETATAMLSRAVAGICQKTLIINLPGSPKAVRQCLRAILPALPHAVETLRGEVGEHGELEEEAGEGAARED